MSWRELRDEAVLSLASSGFENAASDARRIVEEASGYEAGDYHLGLATSATKRGVAHFDSMLARRLAGEPLQYVLGRWGFRTLDLAIDQRVLIPRPETELVAGLGLDELERQAEPGRVLLAADLGTGSGAIGLSLAAERDDTEVVISDVSAGALAVARANVAGLGRPGARVSVASPGRWFEALDPDDVGQFNLVISNPPYVAVDDEVADDVREWEPHVALFSGDSGLADAFEILDAVESWLAPGGAVVLELGERQLERAAAHARSLGLIDVEEHADLAGRPRALVARRS